MNIKVLLTGGRAPATLYLARLLKKHGYSVYVADSIPIYLCQFSNAITESFVIPSAKRQKDYKKSLIGIINSRNINVLIPTCEEIFYISQIKNELGLKTRVFCDTFNKLELLHNKFNFYHFCQKCKISVPQSWLVHSKKEIIKILNKFPSQKFVLKPVYSRFSDQTQFIDSKKKFKLKENIEYILQKYIAGEEMCCYGIAFNGKLKVYSDYKSIFTSGQGTTIAFQYINDKQILKILSKIVKIQQFSGQIALDLIKDKQGRYHVIECNPRLTSGIQLISEDILSTTNNIITPSRNSSSCIKLLLFFFKIKWIKKIVLWKQTILHSKDVIFSIHDLSPFFAQFIVLVYYSMLAIKEKVSLKHITTLDIEWNGK